MVSGTDYSGSWRPNQLVLESQTAAGDLADYGGIPLNDAARLYALSWPAWPITRPSASRTLSCTQVKVTFGPEGSSISADRSANESVARKRDAA